MIQVERPHKPRKEVTFAEAVGMLLGALARSKSQPSVWQSILPVHADGKPIVTFAGKGQDFSRFEAFYLQIGPALWTSTDKQEVVLKILRQYFGITGKPLRVPLVIPHLEQELPAAVQTAIEKNLEGDGARKHFERYFEDFQP